MLCSNSLDDDVDSSKLNGGMDWSIHYPWPTNGVGSVYFPDADTGYIVGTENGAGNGVILKTTNGGIDWSSLRYQHGGF
jgi:photosystem II stability/assembly factor-like uncharacterized protein